LTILLLEKRISISIKFVTKKQTDHGIKNSIGAVRNQHNPNVIY
jgi:hypothetical protein